MISIDKRLQRKLAKALDDAAKDFPKEIKIAVNATAKKTRTQASREIRQELAASAKAVNRALTVSRKATKQKPGATVRLAHEKRLSLKEFKPRQIRKGVSYRISKTTGRQTVKGAFMGPKPGATAAKLRGHVFARKGKARLPIVKLMGASPWGVFKKQGLERPMTKMAKKELKKQIKRRIRFNILKRKGLI